MISTIASGPMRSARAQAQQVDAARGDVLAHDARPDPETGPGQLVQQLAVDQMHLPQIGLGGIRPDPGTVLDRDAHVRVALHAQPGQQRDGRLQRLAEAMPEAGGHGLHNGVC